MNDLAFLDTVLQWRAHGHEVVLVTVARTWGASPRPVGSLLAWRDDGLTVGSVSGGCVEEDLLTRLAARAIALDRPTRLAYGTTRAEAERFGLPCGGRLELVIERLREGDGLLQLHEALQQRHTLTRRLNLKSGAVELLRNAPDRHDDPTMLDRRFGSAWRLLIVGAGDLAFHVAHCAAHLDYEILLCDPRPEARARWTLPHLPVDPRMPDEVATAYGDPRTAVITLTHDPRVDDLALMEALTGDAFYVGALGSTATSARRRERLLQLGLAASAVARLHAPVGLPIGSRTPAEIAISILAEVTAARRALERREPIPAECAA